MATLRRDRRQVLKGAALLGAFAAVQAPATAFAKGEDAAAQGLVGSWFVNITLKNGLKRVNLASFTQDGLALASGSAPLKAPATLDNTTGGLGTWARTADGGFDVTFVQLVIAADGSLGGTHTVNSHITLDAGGDSWSGAFKQAVMANGKVIAIHAGTQLATRITAGSM